MYKKQQEKANASVAAPASERCTHAFMTHTPTWLVKPMLQKVFGQRKGQPVDPVLS